MMSIILLLPVAISTDRSTDRPCALDMCNTARSFTHQSNTCVIRRLAFLNLGIIEQISCTPLPATLYNLASQNSSLSREIECLLYDSHQKGKMMTMIMKTSGSQVDSPVVEGNRKEGGGRKMRDLHKDT